MSRITLHFCVLLEFALPAARGLAQQPAQFIEIPAEALEDKIRGGMLAQVLGNLNGLPHEFKYVNKPGNVEHYTPSLPDGAHTDDDTDIEWVYLREIARARNNFLPPAAITPLWKKHINRRIFCANRYARDLMDLGFEPPWTGNVGLNPWSEFNISGQFVCESFGLMAPAMPQTAARLGLHYTRVAIDGEPAQATQLFTTMIATAFVENDIDKILDAGAGAVDPKCEIANVVATVRKLCQQNPNDWKKTRLAMKERWQKQGGIVRERNGYELNTGCVIAALIYGHKDFVETLRIAFNLGWDADCDAATAATIVGVMKGRRWMNEQGWDIKDIYRNTARDEMPMNETLTGLENLAIEAARITIKSGGGKIPLPPREGQGEVPQQVGNPSIAFQSSNPPRSNRSARKPLKSQISARPSPTKSSKTFMHPVSLVHAPPTLPSALAKATTSSVGSLATGPPRSASCRGIPPWSTTFSSRPLRSATSFVAKPNPLACTMPRISKPPNGHSRTFG